jgi:hypothetical protein
MSQPPAGVCVVGFSRVFSAPKRPCETVLAEAVPGTVSAAVFRAPPQAIADRLSLWKNEGKNRSPAPVKGWFARLRYAI